ncbi:MAG: glycosyltransferase family 9 protein [bacterium]
MIKYKNILVFSFSRIGDVVLSTAVVPPLKRTFPDARISFLVGPRSWEILWGDTRISELIIYDSKGVHKGLTGKLKLIEKLRSKKFDLVVDLRDSFLSHLLGARHWGLPLMERFNPEYRQLHAVDRYLNVLQINGIKDILSLPEIQILPYEKDEARKFLLQRGVKDKDSLIAIHPGGSWRYKLWPVQNFAELGDIIAQKYSAKVLVFTGPDEIELQDQMSKIMKFKPIFIKNIGLRQLAAIIQRCQLYIGNDTGPMHIAVAVGTKVISIFGSTDAMRSGPYGNGHIVISKKIDCSPCHPGNHPGRCNRGSCAAIDSIQLDQVANIVERIMSERPYISC